ncbi:hypothetical protein OROGR_030129 [Orobanche gracilis]
MMEREKLVGVQESWKISDSSTNVMLKRLYMIALFAPRGWVI